MHDEINLLNDSDTGDRGFGLRSKRYDVHGYCRDLRLRFQHSNYHA